MLEMEGDMKKMRRDMSLDPSLLQILLKQDYSNGEYVSC